MNNIKSVILDENVLVNLPAFGDTVVRQPDMVDFVFQTAVWIGDDASIEVSLDQVQRVAEYARMAGVHALHNDNPADMGVQVMTHKDGFVHPAFSAFPDSPKAHMNTLWREIADILIDEQASA